MATMREPPRPGPSRDYFFCEDCRTWQFKNLGGCPCWRTPDQRDDAREPSPADLEAQRRMTG